LKLEILRAGEQSRVIKSRLQAAEPTDRLAEAQILSHDEPKFFVSVLRRFQHAGGTIGAAFDQIKTAATTALAERFSDRLSVPIILRQVEVMKLAICKWRSRRF